MEQDIIDVAAAKHQRELRGKDVKHFTLRLPSAPYFGAEQDESAGLTRLRAMTEIISGSRYTIHALICEIIESAITRGYKLPYPKRSAIPTGASVERIDLRLNQEQIDVLDKLRDEMEPQINVIDFREYYIRPDVVRELIHQDLARVESGFVEKYRLGK